MSRQRTEYEGLSDEQSEWAGKALRQMAGIPVATAVPVEAYAGFQPLDFDIQDIEADGIVDGESVIIRLWPSKVAVPFWSEGSTVCSMIESGVRNLTVSCSHETDVMRSTNDTESVSAYCVTARGFPMKPNNESLYWVVKKIQNIFK